MPESSGSFRNRNQPNCPVCKRYISRKVSKMPVFDRPFSCLFCGSSLLSYPIYDAEGKWIKGEYEIMTLIKVSTPIKNELNNPKIFE